MTDIKKLINKYETPHGENKRVKGEITSENYHNSERQKSTLKDLYLILDTILNETKQPINKQEKREIKNWIQIFQKDWKNIHRQSKNEAIILALIIIQYKNNHYYIPKILKKTCIDYDLNKKKFILIQNRVIFLLMKNTPLKYTVQDKYRQYQKEEILQ